jgi:predicted ATP-grasp superfamily ATP-dependent carboligase
MPDERVMIFGASTRAAAQSAVRAGLRPICADRFADEDLFELAEVLPLARYPHGLIEVSGLVGKHRSLTGSARAPIPWFYTGALENHPRLLKKLAAQQPLRGNPAEAVARVRDPFQVARALTDVGIRALQLCPTDHPPPADGRWLLKPRRSAGGRGIQVWDRSAEGPSAHRRREPIYFQERVVGEPYSGLYVATCAATLLVGVSRQLVGESRLSAGQFTYCGSIGPVDVDEPLQQQISACGMVIAARFGLRGLFGIDFVVDEDSVAWLTEVNPRYTASVEVFESALEIALLPDHLAACAAFDDAGRSRQIADNLRARLETARRSQSSRMCGKAVLYAPFTLRTPNLADVMRGPTFLPRARIADRPRPGTLVPARAPLCSLLIDNPEDLFESGAPLAAFEPALSTLEAHLRPEQDA